MANSAFTQPDTSIFVPKSLYDANTVLAADTDDTPAAVTMGASTILARLASGNIKAASVSELITLLGIPGADGWLASADTWTYASASTFTITGADRTTTYTKGTRLRFTQTTVKYGVVASSSFGGGNTTVTIIVNTDYVLANAAISVNSYSYDANPQGYPGWFTYDCAPTGFSGTPTQGISRFSVVGSACVSTNYIDGTSNASGFTYQLPVAYVARYQNVVCAATNNGGNITAIAELGSTPPSKNVDLYSNPSGAGWTSSGNKACRLTFSYQF